MPERRSELILRSAKQSRAKQNEAVERLQRAIATKERLGVVGNENEISRFYLGSALRDLGEDEAARHVLEATAEGFLRLRQLEWYAVSMNKLALWHRERPAQAEPIFQTAIETLLLINLASLCSKQDQLDRAEAFVARGRPGPSPCTPPSNPRAQGSAALTHSRVIQGLVKHP